MPVDFFFTYYSCTLSKLQSRVNITFICTEKPKNAGDFLLKHLLYCGGLRADAQCLWGACFQLQPAPATLSHLRGRGKKPEIGVKFTVQRHKLTEDWDLPQGPRELPPPHSPPPPHETLIYNSPCYSVKSNQSDPIPSNQSKSNHSNQISK